MAWNNELNIPLDDAAQKENVEMIYEKLVEGRGWTMQAVAAICGNMQVESTINPNVWQGFTVHEETTSLGFGLVQWTPASKIRSWLLENGYSVDSGDGQLERLIKEMEEGLGGQYFINSNRLYPISRTEFIHSEQEPYYLASAFMYNYERPAASSVTASEQIRRRNANYWYEYLVQLSGGEPAPETPEPPEPPQPGDMEVNLIQFLHRSLRSRVTRRLRNYQ